MFRDGYCDCGKLELMSKIQYYVHYVDIDIMAILPYYINMITQRMTAKEARDNFADLLGTVYYGKEPVMVEKKGRPFAVVVNPDEYGNYVRYKEAAKKRVLEILEEIQAANNDKGYEETLKDITEAVEETRKGRYAKKQKSKSGT